MKIIFILLSLTLTSAAFADVELAPIDVKQELLDEAGDLENYDLDEDAAFWNYTEGTEVPTAADIEQMAKIPIQTDEPVTEFQ